MARRARLSTAGLVAALLLVAVHGEEEEEEVKATPVESAISVMLLGSIGFQMLLFYLVHWEDDDIKRYAWRVISTTISIFCAVLIFQGFNGLVEEYAIEGGSTIWKVSINMLQLVFWLTTMQVVLAITSGAVNELWGGTHPSMEKVELNVKSYALLFAHVAGFSAINAWGSLQQSIFKSSAPTALLIVPIAGVGMRMMYHGYNAIREHISHSDDGIVDEFEKVWDDETEDAENEVAGLSLSFLTVQAVRFAIGGVLPNVEGIEGHATEMSHGGEQWQMLLLCGFAFGVCGVILVNTERCIKNPSETVKRVIEILNNYFTFGNAWCFFYGAKWMMCSMRFTDEEALLHVIIALILSAVTFSFIFVLDKVMDNHLLGEDSEMADHAMETFISGLGILIGFSWEQCFDTAVSVISKSNERKCPPALSKLIMSCILVVVVFPAWRRYILPHERELAEAVTEEGQKKSTLKAAAELHYQLMMSQETDEHALDLAHLRMKEHRREAHDLQHPARAAAYGLTLKHFRVTAQGVTEADVPSEHQHEKRKARGAHQKQTAAKEDLLS